MELRHRAQGAGRLSDILKGEMGVSTGLMNKLKWEERILVNGQPQRTNFYVQAGDEVTLCLTEPEPEYPAQEMALTILYEDEAILAVEKPARMLIHPSRSTNTDTLANGIIWHYRQNGEQTAFHPVTRLDRDTFGVVLVAKNAYVHALLQEQGVEKIYHALVFGLPEPGEGTIDAPIARRPLPSLLRYVDNVGKPSVTKYRVIDTMENRSLLELCPVTGRTHQLRVHCAYRGWPILGDPQYGSEESQALSQDLGYGYQRLCSKEVRFTHPITGQSMTIRSKQNAE